MTSAKAVREDVTIPAIDGQTLRGWHYPPQGPPSGAAIVLAHGAGGVKEAGLDPFARAFAADGHTALVFDYRHWGSSDGMPREFLNLRRQREDYESVIAFARGMADVDAAKVFIWGTSFAGMHAVGVAARDPKLAGAIAQSPLVDGLAGASNVPILGALRVAGRAIADVFGSLLGREPRYIPVTTDPGTVGLIATPDAQPGREMILRTLPADVNWPNRITARSLFNIARSRPARRAADIRCPFLMIVAQHDTMAPTKPAAKAAARAPRGQLFRSQGEHYDVYDGGAAFDEVLDLERRFFTRELGRLGANSTSTPIP
jgi:pimeloyl-ACP methyl ester carboxylesterase